MACSTGVRNLMTSSFVAHRNACEITILIYTTCFFRLDFAAYRNACEITMEIHAILYFCVNLTFEKISSLSLAGRRLIWSLKDFDGTKTVHKSYWSQNVVCCHRFLWIAYLKQNALTSNENGFNWIVKELLCIILCWFNCTEFNQSASILVNKVPNCPLSSS